MKKAQILLFIPVISLGVISVFSFTHFEQNNFKAVEAVSLPTTINLNSVSEADVRSYYSSLNGMAESELKGANLLKHLKPVLSQDFVYYSYDQVWKIYEITDRNWELSPASETTYGTYDSVTNTITGYVYYSTLSEKKNNPYVHLLYLNDNDNPDTALRIQDSHSQTTTNPDAINREHCWPQSYGFKSDGTGTNAAKGPAGTDLHHLIAADGQVNSIGHNNYTYGNVATNDSEWAEKVAARPRIENNKRGRATVTHEEGLGNETFIFEPQDSDKGDIARALFYMAAKYNNLAGQAGAISNYDPNLALDNLIYKADQESFYSSDTTPATYGMLGVLLEWNRIDPPDEYEIYRNDLIYRNYQHNRNPFIDFPTWAEYIWGETSGKASPNTDPLNEFEPDEKVLESISVDVEPSKLTYEEGEYFSISGATITAHYQGGEIEDVTNRVTYSQEALKAADSGPFLLTYTHNGVTKTAIIQIVVKSLQPNFNYFIYVGIGIGVTLLASIISVVVNTNKKKKRTTKRKKK